MQQFVQRNLKFNFIVGMLDGGFFGFALGFGSFMAIIPLFVQQLSGSALLIGLIPAIHNFGWLFPQLLIAGWIAQLRRYKPIVLLLTIHERVPYLGLAAVAWFVSSMDPKLAVLLVFLLLSWQGLGGGLAANPWTNMISKVVPPALHGTFFGSQAAAFNGMAGISAILAGLILQALPGPLDFTVCFLLAAIMFGASYAVLALTREAEGPPVIRAVVQTPVWSQAREILRRDPNFAVFLAVRSLSQFASMSFSFYLIYAVIDYRMSEAVAGAMTGFLLIAQVVFNPIMGRLGDRWSHRGVMVAGALAAGLSSMLAWMATSADWFYAVFLLEAIAIIAIWTIPVALTVSFAPEDRRPIYIGLSSTFTAPATILAPIIGGLLADAFGFDTMFLVSALCSLAMAGVLVFLLKEPARASLSARAEESPAAT
jgi:MFS family permease